MGRALCLTAFFVLVACAHGDPEGLPKANALEERGASLLDAGSAAEARELFRLSFRESGGHRFLSAVGLARASLALGDWPGYQQAVERAMAVMEPSAESFDLVGRTLLEGAWHGRGGVARDQATLASSFFVRARRMNAALPGLSYHVGLSRMLSGHPSEAVIFLENSLREEPDLSLAVDALVRCLRQLGARQRLRRDLEALEVAGRLPKRHEKDLEWARAGAKPPPKPKSKPSSGGS